MVLILQLVNQARIPLFAMSFILTQLQMAEAGSKEYLEILSLKSTENYANKSKQEKIKDPTIHFNDVSFRYNDSENVLKGVTFTIEKNQSVALVGHSGAGKSTIINLILKFYEPADGKIFLKDTNYMTLDHTVCVF